MPYGVKQECVCNDSYQKFNQFGQDLADEKPEANISIIHMVEIKCINNLQEWSYIIHFSDINTFDNIINMIEINA